jgi:ribose 5-phosphate isomerase RpiB
MKIAIGTDHAGYELKERFKRELAALCHDVLDLGTHAAANSTRLAAPGCPYERLSNR